METKRSNLDKFATMTKKDSREQLELASRRVLDTLDRMSEIFLPGDPLLKSAGVFPVYYWFIRGIEYKWDPYVREFLNNFEQERKENRDKGREADNELLTFDRFNRSTDDERSHLERHKIIHNWYIKYLDKSQKVKISPNKKVHRSR